MNKVKIEYSELDGSNGMFLSTHINEKDLDAVLTFLAVRRNRKLIFSTYIANAMKYKRLRRNPLNN